MSERGSRAIGRRFLRWVVVPTGVVLGVLFLGSNLVMQSGWVRGRVAGVLAERTQLDWEVGGLSWTPWSGIRVADLRVAVPEADDLDALCRIGEIHVRPEWGQLVRGERGWREIVVRDPEVVIPVEVLAALAAAGPGPRLEALAPAPEPPPKAPVPEPPAPKPPAGKPPVPKPPAPDRPAGTRPAPAKPPVPKRPPGKSPPAPSPAKDRPGPPAVDPPPPPEPSRWIRVEGARVTVYSLRRPEARLELRGVRGELPVAGAAADGWFAADGTWWDGQRIGPAWRELLEWKRPVLVVAERRREWNGLTMQLGGTLQPAGMMRATFQGAIVPGPAGPFGVEALPGIELRAARFGGTVRFAGELRRPSGWRAEARCAGSGLEVTRPGAAHTIGFERGTATAGYRGGVLRVPEARLQSETLSFLGNGLVVSDGRAYGVLRIVADRESAEVATRLALGAFLTGGWTRQWLVPLETPDRYFRDLHVHGRAGQWLVDVGRGGEDLDLAVIWDRLVDFYQRETAEEERGEERSAPREMFRPGR